MSKSIKWTIVSFILAALCWSVEIFINPSGYEVILFILAAASSILFACFLFVSICSILAKKRQKAVSTYKTFAVADLCVGILTAGYAAYDIITANGFFGGIVGVLLLIFAEPIVLVLLLADLIAWVCKDRKKRPQR